MSITRALAEFQHEAGLAHRPAHLSEAENAKTLDADAFTEAAWRTFRDAFGDRPEAEVTAVASQVAQDWKGTRGRDMAMTQDDAEALAYEVGNRMSGAGSGVRMLAGSAPGNAERPESGTAEALRDEQRKLFG